MTPLFSTAYLPPIQYVASLMQHTGVQIEAQETYPKQTYRNRALILTAAGVQSLIVPVIRTHGNRSRTDQIAIDYRTRWNVIHLRTIEAAYAASPFYLYYKDSLEAALIQRYDRLLDLNQALLTWLQKCLKTNVKTEFTTDWLPLAPNGVPAHLCDYRNAFSPKPSPSLPTPLPSLPPYYQVFSDRHPFAPNLSTLDLLFNLGSEAPCYLLNITP